MSTNSYDEEKEKRKHAAAAYTDSIEEAVPTPSSPPETEEVPLIRSVIVPPEGTILFISVMSVSSILDLFPILIPKLFAAAS